MVTKAMVADPFAGVKVYDPKMVVEAQDGDSIAKKYSLNYEEYLTWLKDNPDIKTTWYFAKVKGIDCIGGGNEGPEADARDAIRGWLNKVRKARVEESKAFPVAVHFSPKRGTKRITSIESSEKFKELEKTEA